MPSAEPSDGAARRPHRMLIAAPFYPPHLGGVERYSAGVAEELVKRGWEVDVLACRLGTADELTRLGGAGERVFELDGTVVAGRLPFPLPTKRNRAILTGLRARHHDVALIQTHLFVSSLLAASIARRARRLWLNHGSGHVPGTTRLVSVGVAAYEHALGWLLRHRVEAVAAVSRESARWLVHLGVKNAVSVGNAVRSVESARPPREHGPLRVLYAGRLEPGKGADVAIHVVRAARSAGPITFTMCGDGTQRDAVLAAVEREPGVVDYRGPVDHEALLQLMSENDVFIYPSSYPEGFPTVLLEAGSRACAVLTFPVAGSAELLEQGGGWRVSDADEAIAVLSELAGNHAVAAQAGEQLRRRVEEQYTWLPVTDRILQAAHGGEDAE